MGRESHYRWWNNGESVEESNDQEAIEKYRKKAKERKELWTLKKKSGENGNEKQQIKTRKRKWEIESKGEREKKT